MTSRFAIITIDAKQPPVKAELLVRSARLAST